MKAIQDEFAMLPLSRQRKYQLRKLKDGVCPECGEARHQGSVFCAYHIMKKRRQSAAFQRRLNGYKKWKPGRVGRPPLPPLIKGVR